VNSNSIPLTNRGAWWREPEVFVLIVLVAAAYLVRINDVPIRGEEPRRAQVAFEILQRGDWIVPREQGEPFLSRPPLQNWLIAGSTLLFGTWDAWAIRLPSVLAMLFTTLLVYGYSRSRMSRVGALAAALAFATFAEMFTTGAQAETEMVFIALVAASLLLWHWGQLSGWPAMATWIASYVFVALGFLCKGPQAPVYFAGGVGIYLLLTGNLRTLFTRAHFVGASIGIAIVLAWLIPCALEESLPVVKGIVMSDTGMRFRDWEMTKIGKHLLQYPLEIIGCTLPWSPLLVAYVFPGVRRALGDARPLVLFMGICLLVAFPTCWIPPDAQTRYFNPLYPCIAVLVGAVVDFCSRANLPASANLLWRRSAVAIAGLMVLAGLAVPVGSVVLANRENLSAWSEVPIVSIGYTAAAFALAWFTYNSRDAGDSWRTRTAVLAVACFMVLTCTGIVTNIRIRRSEDHGIAVAQLKQQLPAETHLVSFGHIDALFAYYYARPIESRPFPDRAEDVPDNLDYFCFDTFVGYRPQLPFAWEEIVAIPMDRYKWPPPTRVVVVGRRLTIVSPQNRQ
jgi:4-amino-4-deoxy-L-arabinose transferase-like glycosyltransferase